MGKGTVIADLRRRRPELRLSVSWTTRPQRPSEVDGAHYRFVDRERFLQARERGEFVEWEEYRGHLYGTPFSEVKRTREASSDLLLEIDVRGAKSVKRMFPEAVTIFLEPPSVDALAERLRGRGTDTEEQVRARLEAATEELRAATHFDHVVLNREVDAAVAQILAILDG